ncbi:hypothetical protein KO494_03360 [Lacinutrix sp. C3R15]|uniref:hypothetical protein n=1 Tax=Flavobacteriaceae TaxID=49546 RepID=UPI001C0953D7|nr:MULTISPECIES: hypothetical protein [Flavobacteriaceae]MBU2938570.1 hypothetical protein [Lacinutrix sp. C3R15]MDO6621884.1 hypothetical protein [Oceanihabitans sp. 1_MG-2023]
MFNKIIVFVFLFINISAFAHQPETSTTMLVEKENNTWILQISASLTAFQQEIKTLFPEYNTPEEFKQMVIEHVKNNIEIIINNNQNIELSSGIVKLGHETKVVFEVLGVPSEIKNVSVKNSTFKDVFNNKSALVLLKNGFKKEHFVLNNKNNHTLKLVANQNNFVVKTIKEANFFSTKRLFVLLGILSVALLFKLLIFRKL